MQSIMYGMKYLFFSKAQSCNLQRLNGASTPCFETNIAPDSFEAFDDYGKYPGSTISTLLHDK